MEIMTEALIALETGSAREAVELPSLKLASRARTVADWAGEITKFLERGRRGTLDLARTVYQAKTSLYYGQWSDLWTEHRLAFSKRKAEMFAVVGREFGELNAQTFARLPGGWSILYQLARLSRPDFELLLAQEKIHPALTLAQAKELVAHFNGQSESKSRHPGIKLRLHLFCDFVRQTSGDWTAAERDLVRAELCQLALELKEADIPLPSVNRLFNASTSLAAGSPRN